MYAHLAPKFFRRTAVLPFLLKNFCLFQNLPQKFLESYSFSNTGLFGLKTKIYRRDNGIFVQNDGMRLESGSQKIINRIEKTMRSVILAVSSIA